MDDKRLFSFVLILSLLTATVGGASELEYISPAKREELKTAFDAAKPGAGPRGSWACDMYGVRTSIQIQRDVKLYEFSLSGANAVKNSGAQPVADYAKDSSGWVGKTTRLKDEIRVGSDGKLRGRLALNDGTVLAYSVCHSL